MTLADLKAVSRKQTGPTSFLSFTTLSKQKSLSGVNQATAIESKYDTTRILLSMANDQAPASKQTLPPVPLRELLKLLGDFAEQGQIDTYYDSEGNAVAEWNRQPEPEEQEEKAPETFRGRCLGCVLSNTSLIFASILLMIVSMASATW